jgi:hypothetical protein
LKGEKIVKTISHSIRWVTIGYFFVAWAMCTNLPVHANPLEPYPNPTGGALTGERFRVIVSTDIGGGDEDDDQSMVHYLLYADLFDRKVDFFAPRMDQERPSEVIEPTESVLQP